MTLSGSFRNQSNDILMEERFKEIIFGRHPVLDAIQSGATVDKVLLQEGVRGDFEKELRHACKASQIPLLVVPKERFAKWVKGANHQGVLAFISPIAFHKLEEVLPGVFERGETPLFLVLDGITDVRNFGAIARTAEVCGAHALIVPRKNTAWINAEAMKASAGALNRIPVCRESSLVVALELLQQSGVQVLASDLQAESYLFDIDFSVPLALVLGSEGEGISPAISKKADTTFKIPQKGLTDSFNVSVAAGIMLYEVLRQRWAAG
ncbi:MAG: 23S rRNA (guanosine(2251)-2'-O)-methyltransferase RlmB [Saprospiraceae bacterium]